MALSFAFGGDDGSSYDDLKRRQELARLMWAGGNRGAAPKTAMEGINSAAQSITGALLAKKLGQQIKGQQDEFGMLFNGALGGFGAQPAGQPSFSQPNPMDEAFPVGQTGAAPARDSVAVGGKEYDMGQPADMGMFIKQGLVKRGLPEHVADAFVMNFKDESGLNPGINERQPLVPGSRGGFGLAQWTGPRRKALEAFAQQRGMPVDDPNLQMDFLVQELQGPEAKAAQSILGAPDAGTAATAIVNNFLRPAEEHRAARASRYGGVQTADAGGINPMLLSMVSDPRATPEQRSVLQMLMQQQMQAADPMRQLQMQNLQGQIDARANPAPVKREIITGADGYQYYADDQSRVLPRVQMPKAPGYRTLSSQEAAEMGLPDGAYQIGPDNKVSQIGGGGVTVNNDLGGGKFDEAFAKGDATILSTVSESGLAARRNIGRIDQLETLLGKSDTGFTGAAKLAAGEWGIDTEGLDELQAAQALINSLVPEQRQPGSGPMSDADLALFKQSLPRIINQPGGNTTIIQTMRAIAQYDAEGAAIVQDLRAGNISRAEAFESLQNRQNPLAGFTPPPAGDVSDQPLTSDDYKNLSDEELLERLRAK